MSRPSEDERAIDLALAEWLTTLGRANGEQYRPAFKDWLAADPRRQAAYRSFKALDRDVARTSLPIPPLHAPHQLGHRFAIGPAAIAALVLLAVGGGGAFFVLRPTSQTMKAETRYAAGDTPRAVDLPDGPSLMLDAHAVILTSFEAGQPVLSLQQGRVRVRLPASDNRPYVVAAGDLRMTAHGAVFDVAREPDAVRVTALAGDVVTRHAEGPPVGSLQPGRQLVASPRGDQIMPAMKNEPNWTSALLPLDGKTLADLVAIGNRGRGKVIVLGDADLAGRPVQGQLPVKDTHILALQIAAAFDLNVRETQAEYILTRKS